MFKKILIANRGEIACRIMRTARRMGIATVAVYSDADAGTPHVMMADEAVHIGGAASANSYLRGERIIAAAKETGAEAIHPGFGFLSENAGFVAEVEAAGLVFIGPGTKAIAVMGDKIESKALAKSAGVSTVPGTEGEVDDVEVGLKAAAACRRLDHDRITDLGRSRQPDLDVINLTLGSGHGRDTGGFGQRLGFDLVAHHRDGLGARSDEDEAGRLDFGDKSRILGQETKAGMDRLGTRLLRRRDDALAAKIAVGRSRAADVNGLVGHHHMRVAGVGVGICLLYTSPSPRD